MRKNMLRKIIKETKKNNLIGVTFEPTLEECDFLYENNINITKHLSKRTSLFLDDYYFIDTLNFVKEN
ncbi:MAG: hypothetical protein ACI4U0_04020 [Candidatus Aphodocola sp.]